MSETVMAGPEFGLYRVMRPFERFVSVYDGEAVVTPLMLSENGQARDKRAEDGISGYDPNLVRGLTTPLGSRVIVLVPSLTTNSLPAQPYLWQFIWRVRNVFDHRVTKDATRPPYHFAKQGQGVPDTTGANPGPRVVIQAAWQGVVYNQDEPTGECQHARQKLRAEDIFACATAGADPLMPDGSTGAIQQGVLPSTVPEYRQPKYIPHEMQAIGDELLIAVTRDASANPLWDFAGVDANLAELLGSSSPDLGALVTMGVSP